MLTYNEIQRIYRAERRSTTLQKIPENFYSDLSEFLSKIDEENKQNINKLFNEICEMRRNKIVIHALYCADEPPNNIITVEKPMYDEFSRLISEYNKRILVEIKNSVKESRDVDNREKENTVKVKITRALQSIIGSDMLSYGPFKGGEIVELPVDTAKILIRQNSATKV